jgi:tRNA(adenine34) deaminase
MEADEASAVPRASPYGEPLAGLRTVINRDRAVRNYTPARARGNVPILLVLDDLMEAALAEARRARDAGEVPIGAVVAMDGVVVGRGFNQPISSGDPTAHAEIVAIRDAAARVGNYRLTGAVVCVTIEPCLMCVGALVHARVGTLVFGATEPKTGAVVSTARGLELGGHNHRVEVVAGIREAECRDLMQAFFLERRQGSAKLGMQNAELGIDDRNS